MAIIAKTAHVVIRNLNKATSSPDFGSRTDNLNFCYVLIIRQAKIPATPVTGRYSHFLTGRRYFAAPFRWVPQTSVNQESLCF